MLRITAYADRLLEDLEDLDWPEGIKAMQRNWIGRSEGAEVTFRVDGSSESFSVFTTRPDTLFGATYCVLAPEHPIVDRITTGEQRAVVDAYRARAAGESEFERTDLGREKTGAFTGAYAVNPANSKPIPIWIADYVLSSYGTGAIMAVPAHDARDHEFAAKFGLPIRQVIAPPSPVNTKSQAYEGDGIAINSAFLDGLRVAEAKERILQWLEEKGLASRKVQYRLRDWLFSRQRYWGEPIPMLHLADGSVVPLPEDSLPLLPPELDDLPPDGQRRAAAREDHLDIAAHEIFCQCGQPIRVILRSITRLLPSV